MSDDNGIRSRDSNPEIGVPELVEGLLPYLPVEKVRAAYKAAPGNEMESGKFASQESSAALAANTFGYFLEKPKICRRFLASKMPVGLPNRLLSNIAHVFHGVADDTLGSMP